MPELRFPEFSGEWEEKKLSDLADVKGGKRLPKGHSLVNYDTGYPYIKVADFEKMTVNKDNLQFLLKETQKIIKNYFITSNDVYLSIAGTIGLSGTIPIYLDGANLTENAAKLYNFKNIDQKFLVYSLYSTNLVKQVKSSKTLGSQPKLALSRIRNFKVIIPSSQEQEKISSFLSKVDEKIEKLEKKQNLWETYKKGMMQQIFSQELRFKDENGADYSDWEEKRLDDVSECLDNMRKPLNANDRLKIQGNIPYYGANGIVDYVKDYIFDEPLVLLAEDGGNFEEFQNRPIAQLVIGKSWVNNHAHVLRNDPDISIEFLFYSLVHKDIRKYINGTSRSKLNKKDMLSIQLKIPSILEQTRIVKIFSSIDSKLDQIKKEIKLNHEFKIGLLQQMFC